jgi:hypothetical protein
MSRSLISAESIVDYFLHAYDVHVELLQGQGYKPDDVIWVFGLHEKSSALSSLPGFTMYNCSLEAIYFEIRQTVSIPQSLSGKVMFEGNSLTVLLEAGALRISDNQWTMDIVDTAVSMPTNSLALTVDETPLINWADSRAEIVKWKAALDAHKEFAIARNQALLKDKVATDSATPKARKDGLQPNGVYLRQVAFVTNKAGDSKVDCKLFFKEYSKGKEVYQTREAIRRSSPTSGLLKLDQLHYCFDGIATDLECFELRCEVIKSGTFNARSLRTEGIIPRALINSESGQEVVIEFKLWDGSVDFGAIMFTFSRPKVTALLSTRQLLEDPYLRFRISKVKVSKLPNVELFGDGNDPFVTMLRLDTNESWKLKEQNDAGESAEWSDSSFKFPVGISFYARRSQLGVSKTTSQFSVEVYDHNTMRGHTFIGKCSMTLSVDLADRKVGEASKLSLILETKGKKNQDGNAGEIEFEIIRYADAAGMTPTEEADALGPKLISQGMVSEKIVATLEEQFEITEGEETTKIVESTKTVLLLLSGGTLNLGKSEIEKSSCWSVTFALSSLRALGALADKLKTPEHAFTFRIRGHKFGLRTIGTGSIARPPSLISTMIEALDAGQSMPVSVERSAILLHHSICLMSQETRTKREPLSSVDLDLVLEQLQSLYPVAHQNNITQMESFVVDDLVAACKESQTAQEFDLYVHIAGQLQNILCPEEFRQLEVPQWLLRSDKKPSSSAAVRFEDMVDTLLRKFEDARAKVNTASNCFATVVALLMYHFEIMCLLKKPCTLDEVKLNFDELSNLARADGALYSHYVDALLVQISELLAAPEGHYEQLRQLSQQLVHAIRPVNLHQLKWSNDFVAENQDKFADGMAVILLDSRKRIKGQREPAATKSENTVAAGDATDSNTAISLSHNARVKIVVSGEQELPISKAVPYSELATAGESCFRFLFAESSRQPSLYRDEIVRNSKKLCFQEDVQASEDGTEVITLLSNGSTQLLRNQYTIVDAIVRYFLSKLVTCGDNWSGDDFAYVFYKLKELSLAINIEGVKLLATSFVSRIKEELYTWRSGWRSAINSALESFAQGTHTESSTEVLGRVSAPLAHLWALRDLRDLTCVSESDDDDPFTAANYRILAVQQGFRDTCEKPASMDSILRTVTGMAELYAFFGETGHGFMSSTHPRLQRALSLSELEDSCSLAKYLKSLLVDGLSAIKKWLLAEAERLIKSKDGKAMFAHMKCLKNLVQPLQAILSSADYTILDLDQILSDFHDEFHKYVLGVVSSNRLNHLETFSSGSANDSYEVLASSLEYLRSIFGPELKENCGDGVLIDSINSLQQSLVDKCIKFEAGVRVNSAAELVATISEASVIDNVYGIVRNHCTSHYKQELEAVYDKLVSKVLGFVYRDVDDFDGLYKSAPATRNIMNIAEQMTSIYRRSQTIRQQFKYSLSIATAVSKFEAKLEKWGDDLVTEISTIMLSMNVTELKAISGGWRRLNLFCALKPVLTSRYFEAIEVACKEFESKCVSLLKIIGDSSDVTVDVVKVTAVLCYLCAAEWIIAGNDVSNQTSGMLWGIFRGRVREWKSSLQSSCDSIDIMNVGPLSALKPVFSKYLRESQAFATGLEGFDEIKDVFVIDSNLIWNDLVSKILSESNTMMQVCFGTYDSTCRRLLRDCSVVGYYVPSEHRDEICRDFHLAADGAEPVVDLSELRRLGQLMDAIVDLGNTFNGVVDVNYISGFTETLANIKAAINRLIAQVPKDVIAAWNIQGYSTINDVLTKASGSGAYEEGYEAYKGLFLAEVDKLSNLLQLHKSSPAAMLSREDYTSMIGILVELRRAEEQVRTHTAKFSNESGSHLTNTETFLRQSLKQQLIAKAHADVQSGKLFAARGELACLEDVFSALKKYDSSYGFGLDFDVASLQADFDKRIEENKALVARLVQMIRMESFVETEMLTGLKSLSASEYWSILNVDACAHLESEFATSFDDLLKYISTNCKSGQLDIDTCEYRTEFVESLFRLLPQSVRVRCTAFDACSLIVKEERIRVDDIKSGIMKELAEVAMLLSSSATLSSGLAQLNTKWMSWERYYSSSKTSTNKLDQEIKASIEGILRQALATIVNVQENNAVASFDPLLYMERNHNVFKEIYAMSGSTGSAGLRQALDELAGSQESLFAGVLSGIEALIVQLYASICDDVASAVKHCETEASKEQEQTEDDKSCELLRSELLRSASADKLVSIYTVFFPRLRSKCCSQSKVQPLAEFSRVQEWLPEDIALSHFDSWSHFGKNVLSSSAEYTADLFTGCIRRLCRYVRILSEVDRAEMSKQVRESSLANRRQIYSAVTAANRACVVAIGATFSPQNSKTLVTKMSKERSDEMLVVDDGVYREASRHIFLLNTVLKEFVNSSLWNLSDRRSAPTSPAIINSSNAATDIDYASITSLSWCQQQIQTLLHAADDRVRELLSSAGTADDQVIDTVARIIVELWFLSEDHLSMFHEDLKSTARQFVDLVKAKGVQWLRKLSGSIDRCNTVSSRAGVGDSLLHSHSAFLPYILAKENAQRNQTTEDQVLDNLVHLLLSSNQVSHISPAKRAQYAQYMKEFRENWTALVKGRSEDSIKTSVRTRVSEDLASRSGNQQSMYELVRFLLASIFAMWTLEEVNKDKEQYDLDSQLTAVVSPHHGQVLSLLILFDGITVSTAGGSTSVKVVNQFIQIGTGEGKSVTIAVAACVFALLGMSVDCTCYSTHLCQRDHAAFRELFKEFEVAKYITYQTFDKQCEKFVTQKLDQFGGIQGTIDFIIHHGKVPTADDVSPAQKVVALPRQQAPDLTVRDKFRSYVHKVIAQNKAPSDRNSILLIDEVDMFFSDNFFGQMLSIVANVKDSRFSELLLAIWEDRERFTTVDDVLTSREFLELGLPTCWVDLLRYTVQAVLMDRDTVLQKSHEPCEFQDMQGKGLRVLYKGSDGSFTDSLSFS